MGYVPYGSIPPPPLPVWTCPYCLRVVDKKALECPGCGAPRAKGVKNA